MTWQKTKMLLRLVWIRFNDQWDHAAEMQKRIEEEKLKHLKHYPIGSFHQRM